MAGGVHAGPVSHRCAHKRSLSLSLVVTAEGQAQEEEDILQSPFQAGAHSVCLISFLPEEGDWAVLSTDGEEGRVRERKKGRWGRKRGMERDSCLALAPAGWILAHSTALGTAPGPLLSQRCFNGAIILFFGRLAENSQPLGPHFLKTGPEQGFFVLGAPGGASGKGSQVCDYSISLPPPSPETS